MTSFTPDFFFKLEQVSAPSIVNVLAGLAGQQDLDGLEAFIVHAEQNGLSRQPTLNQSMSIYTGQDSAAQRYSVSSERFTDALAWAFAPRDTSNACMNDPQRNAQAWTPHHADLSRRLINLMAGANDPLKTVLLTDFAFDFATVMANAEVTLQLVQQGVGPMVSGKSLNGDVHCLAKHAMLAGNLSTCITLVRAMSSDEIKEFTESLSNSHDFETTNALVQSLMDNVAIAPFLEVLDECADGQEVRNVRIKIMMRYLNTCIDQHHPWASCDLRQIVGATPGQSLDDTPMVQALNNPKAASNGDGLIKKVINAAIESHCTDLLKACRSVLSDCYGPNEAFSLDQTADNVAMVIAHEDGSLVPTCAERFKETVQLMLAQGFRLNGNPLITLDRPFAHAVASNSIEADRLAKLAILLGLGMDPATKNTKGRTAVDDLNTEIERERWLSVVRSFQARTVAKSVIDSIQATKADVFDPHAFEENVEFVDLKTIEGASHGSVLRRKGL